MFLENMALAFFLGMCSFLACSKKVETALGLGVAVVFVQTLTVPLNNLILRYLLAEGALGGLSPALATVNLTFLAFILFIGTVAAATQVVEMAVDRFLPTLYSDARRVPAADRGELRHPRRFTLHAGARLHLRRKRGLRFRFGHGLHDRDRQPSPRYARRWTIPTCPAGLRGLGITFVTAGLMSIAFMVFSGIQL